MATLTMYDSVDVSTIPPNPEAVAGYVGGSWPNYNELVAKFPHAHHLSIAVEANEHARCLDVEPLDATNAQAPGWFKSSLADKSQGKAVLYTSASNVQALMDAMSAAGIARSEYYIWSAHYSNEHICGPNVCGYPQADATQWTDHSQGRNLDQSLVHDYFFGVKPAPTPSPRVDPHYDWFDDKPRRILLKKRTERGQVELYDKLRAEQTDKKHPHRIQLAFVRQVLKSFAGRVNTVAHKELVNGKPSWDVDHRGWRYQELIHRAQGQRVV